MDRDTLHAKIVETLAAGLTPEAVADAICDAVLGPVPEQPEPVELPADDPAVTGLPRDETHDSVDPNTGTLTPEAVAKRAADAQALADAEAKQAADKQAADDADAALAKAQSDDQAAHAALDADDQSVSDAQATLAADDAATS